LTHFWNLVEARTSDFCEGRLYKRKGKTPHRQILNLDYLDSVKRSAPYEEQHRIGHLQNTRISPILGVSFAGADDPLLEPVKTISEAIRAGCVHGEKHSL
jgi:hypothetical protein